MQIGLNVAATADQQFLFCRHWALYACTRKEPTILLYTYIDATNCRGCCGPACSRRTKITA